MSRTELQFQNHAVSLLAPHIAFRLGTVASFTVTLGKPIRYQFRGDGLNNTTLYLTGGDSPPRIQFREIANDNG